MDATTPANAAPTNDKDTTTNTASSTDAAATANAVSAKDQNVTHKATNFLSRPPAKPPNFPPLMPSDSALAANDVTTRDGDETTYFDMTATMTDTMIADDTMAAYMATNHDSTSNDAASMTATTKNITDAAVPANDKNDYIMMKAANDNNVRKRPPMTMMTI